MLNWAFPVGHLLVFARANFGREVALMYSTLDDALKFVQVVELSYLAAETAAEADVA